MPEPLYPDLDAAGKIVNIWLDNDTDEGIPEAKRQIKIVREEFKRAHPYPDGSYAAVLKDALERVVIARQELKELRTVTPEDFND